MSLITQRRTSPKQIRPMTSSFAQCKRILTHRGIYLSTVPNLLELPQLLLAPLRSGKTAGFAATGLRSAQKKAADLATLNDLIAGGKLRAVIDRCYPMEEIVDAHRYVETGRKKGNVVITVIGETA
ncbi:MAG: zinc-binding dehydrogenase [Anaerolineae bacterium]